MRIALEEYTEGQLPKSRYPPPFYPPEIEDKSPAEPVARADQRQPRPVRELSPDLPRATRRASKIGLAPRRPVLPV